MHAIVTVINVVFAVIMGGLALASLYERMDRHLAADLGMRCAVVMGGFYVVFGVYAALHHSWLWLYTPFVLLGVVGLGWLRWKFNAYLLSGVPEDGPEDTADADAEEQEPPTA